MNYDGLFVLYVIGAWDDVESRNTLNQRRSDIPAAAERAHKDKLVLIEYEFLVYKFHTMSS